VKVIYDIEQFPNCHTFTGMCLKTGKIHEFVIHESRNDFKSYIEFLSSCQVMVGYNNLTYDYPMINYIIRNREALSKLSPEKINKVLKDFSDNLVNKESFGISKKDILIPQLDLFKIQHFDNKAKITSLKKLQFNLRWENVQESEIGFNAIVKEEDLPEILSYNLNDVLSTYELYKVTKPKIDMRALMSKEYKLELSNDNDPKLGTEIILEEYCKRKGLNKEEVRKMRSPVESIALKDVVLDYIHYDTVEFEVMKDWFCNQVIKGTNGVFKKIPASKLGKLKEYVPRSYLKNGVLSDLSLHYKDRIYIFGSGGLHMNYKKGIFEENEDWCILDLDVASYYPNLAIINNFYPKHLGIEFCDIFLDIYNRRSKLKKMSKDKQYSETERKRYKLLEGGLKLSLNGSFGKTNSEFSFLYYPVMTMQICINGQLLLMKLLEMIYKVSDIEPIQANTDGITLLVRRDDLDKIKEAVKEWEELTKLQMEDAYYSKMIIRDCNNYIAVNKDGTVKTKGVFETNESYKDYKNNPLKELYKDHSAMIIPKALLDYFVGNIPVETTIRACDDIFDFYLMLRGNKAWGVETMYCDDENEVQSDEEQKITRYYISKQGKALSKYNKEINKRTSTQKGYVINVCNKHDKTKAISEYDINYNFYIAECNKIINSIINSQQTLF